MPRRSAFAHETLTTDELSHAEYLRNAPDRCFHCKTELYEQLSREAQRRGFAAIVNGANADDLGDFRPGMQAARDFAVRSPLAECGLTKAAVRELARHWDIDAWDKPATPCLSSRIAYGVSVTPDRLARIDAAEQLLRSLGLGTVRVRLHENELARLEVPLESFAAPVRARSSSRARRASFAPWASATSRSTWKASAPAASSSSCQARS